MNKLNLNHGVGSGRTILQGNAVLPCPPPCGMTDGLCFSGSRQDSFSLDTEQLSRGLLVVGSTGTGKTNFLSELLRQIRQRLDRDSILFVFDPKGDYLARFFEPGNPDHIVISTAPEHGGIARAWNLFGELFDEEGKLGTQAESMAREIAAALFKGMEGSAQPFFSLAAAETLAALLIALFRSAEETHDYKALCNRTFVDFVGRARPGDYFKLLDRYIDLAHVHSYLGDTDKLSPQALGVLGTLNAVVPRMFISSFRDTRPSGQFSARRLAREKGGRTVFLEYDLRAAKTQEPILSLLIDLVLKEALALGRGNTYLLIDELRLLPYVDMLETACNFGRSRGVKTIAALQSVNQLTQIYGESRAGSTLAGFSSLIGFRASDAETRAFLSDRFGRTFETFSFGGLNLPHDGYAVSDADLLRLEPGESFVETVGYPPFRFRFNQYR